MYLFLLIGGYPDLDTSEILHSDGTVSPGKTLPTPVYGHCMVTINDGRIMILGGSDGSIIDGKKNVWIYDHEDETFTPGPKMAKDHYWHSCTLFKSAMHNYREVALVAGGIQTDTVELWDYQTEGSKWITSKWNFVFELNS